MKSEKELEKLSLSTNNIKSVSGGKNEDKKCPLGCTAQTMGRFNPQCKKNVCGKASSHIGPYIYCEFFEDLN